MKQRAMSKQSGFTLIELVIVIVILGILSATAVPKFINLQGDARESSLNGVKAALEGAATLAYSRAAIDGVESSSGSQNITMAGSNVTVSGGYPTADAAGITLAVDLGSDDWAWDYTGISGARITASGGVNTIGTCDVQYSLGSNGARPSITVNTGC